jgi:hypothetical protein
MRNLMLAGLALSTVLVAPPQAVAFGRAGQWCRLARASERGGECTFHTFEQCAASTERLNGVGCYQNPFYRGSWPPAADRAVRHQMPRHNVASRRRQGAYRPGPEDPRVRHNVYALRRGESGIDAHRCVSVFLHIHRLRHSAQAKGRRLLCVLLLWLRAMPSDSGGTGTPSRSGRCTIIGSEPHLQIIRCAAH